MKVTLLVGTTSTEVGKKKPTKFFGGETPDLVDREAQYLLDNNFAAKPGSKVAKAFLATLDENPRTRRIDLEAKTPGLAAKLREKSRLRRAGERLNDDDDDNRDDEGGLRGRGEGGRRDRTETDKDKDKGGGKGDADKD